MDIFLAPEAVFPIIKDENGNLVADKPATNFSVAGTIQCEGKMAGISTLFVRTAGCNLRCMWYLPNGEVNTCDTMQASFDTKLKTKVPVEKVCNTIVNNIGKMGHLVISGGEPLLQAEALAEMVKMLKKTIPGLHVSIETNGTLYNEELACQLDFFSISPKLHNAVPSPEKLAKTGRTIPLTSNNIDAARVNIEAIQLMINQANTSPNKDFQLKFVVQEACETEEIEETFLSKLTGWKPSDIVLMPLGSTSDYLHQTRMTTIEAAISKGWRYSPRLQVNYFNGIAGV